MHAEYNSDDLIDFLKTIDRHARTVFRHDADGSFSDAATKEVQYHLQAAQEILATGEALPKSRRTAIWKATNEILTIGEPLPKKRKVANRKRAKLPSGEARIAALFEP